MFIKTETGLCQDFIKASVNTHNIRDGFVNDLRYKRIGKRSYNRGYNRSRKHSIRSVHLNNFLTKDLNILKIVAWINKILILFTIVKKISIFIFIFLLKNITRVKFKIKFKVYTN